MRSGTQALLRRNALPTRSRSCPATVAETRVLHSGQLVIMPAVTQVRTMTEGGKSREQRRFQQGADGHTGDQMMPIEPPDLTETIRFRMGGATRDVRVPEIPMDRRRQSDLVRDRTMHEKFGAEGPGEKVQRSPAEAKRDMLQKQQDIDGLPWEVRWRKNLVPTQEEIISDIRDRYELWEQDPIRREEQWYLHWKDRLFKVQPDRLVWSQGYTDYFDHYDANGRRKNLPNQGKWGSTTWKTLEDKQFKNRMWFVESEERKLLASTENKSQEELIKEHEAKEEEMQDVFFGMQYGVIDVEKDQAYKALSGSGDPYEIAKTKYDLQRYGAEVAAQATKNPDEVERDPKTGLPVSDIKPLGSGLTIQEGIMAEYSATVKEEEIETKADVSGEQTLGYTKLHLEETRKTGGRPPIQFEVEKVRDMFLKDKEKEKIAAAADEAKKPRAALGEDDKSDVSLETKGTKDHGKRESSAASSAAATAAPQPPGEPTSAEAITRKRREEIRKLENPPLNSGFINVSNAPVPDGEAPDVNKNAPIYYHMPDEKEDKVLREGMPEWYRKGYVDTDAPIRHYAMTGDPLEMADVPFTPEKTHIPEDEFVTNDRSTMGDNAFDEMKIYMQRSQPEAAQGDFKPLPTYDEATADLHVRKTRSLKEMSAKERIKERLRRQREARRRLVADGEDPAVAEISAAKEAEASVERETRSSSSAAQQGGAGDAIVPDAKEDIKVDTDLLLPDLPWESDSVVDPYRGVRTGDELDTHFNKTDLEKTWQTYRGYFTQQLKMMVQEKENSTDLRNEKMLREAMARIRAGDVGEHPEVDHSHVAVFRLVFEAHCKQALGDYFAHRGGKKPDAEMLKADADDMLRKAQAKSKACGKRFLDFVQEMTSLELQNVRKNPVQKNRITYSDKKYEPIGKPFLRWINEDLTDFIGMEFHQVENIENHKEMLMRKLADAQHKCPPRVQGVKDSVRDYVVQSFYCACRANLLYYAAKHLWHMYLSEHPDGQLKNRAEEIWNECYEVMEAYYKYSKDVGVQIPLANTDADITFDDKEFVEGENAANAEIAGDFQRAERIWHSGTVLRWFPLYDETDFMLFYERRGKMTQATEVSDRSLENMNKRTHPSVHPFPARAKKFLEGAPLSQETAEHLWLRHMGDIYSDHSDFMMRVGRYATGRRYYEQAVNFYHVAIRTAKEKKLPADWRALLLTRAKYLAACSEGKNSPDVFLAEVESVASDIRKLSPTLTEHWSNRNLELPVHTHLLNCVMPLYAKRIADRAKERTCETVGGAAKMGELVLEAGKLKAQGKHPPVEIEAFDEAVDEEAEIFRQKVLQWQAEEPVQQSDTAVFYMMYYFYVRVRPKNPEEVDKYKEMIWPLYDTTLTQASIGIKSRCKLLPEVVRRICHIYAVGSSVEQKQFWLKELETLLERLPHVFKTQEMKKAISSLEVAIDAQKNGAVGRKIPPVYIAGTGSQYNRMEQLSKLTHNPILKNDMATVEYEKLRRREMQVKESSPDEISLRQAGSRRDPTIPESQQEGAQMGARQAMPSQVHTPSMRQRAEGPSE